MAEVLTKQQHMAVNDRGGNLLVSAAAGSGKTKVLIDRLLSYVLDTVKPANLDDFLIITYTKAAASELRVKIAAKLMEKMSEQPENRHLQQQFQRLHLTKISTVHSYCTDILREYAYCLDVTANFRVADEDECLELMTQALQKVLDESYGHAHENTDFCAFVDTQGFGRDDRRISEIIIKVYNSSRCHLNPNEWLNWCESLYEGNYTDASETIWGHYLIEDLQRCLDLQIHTLEKCAVLASQAEAMEKVAQLLQTTIDQLYALRACKKWDDICKHRKVDYGRLVFSKKITDISLSEQIKAAREACKSGLDKKLLKFADTSEQLLCDYKNTAYAAKGLIQLVRRFSDTYQQMKRSRHILDFSDLEHKTLDLLIGRSRNTVTKNAQEIGMRFREVMVDEYQDSNAVQEAIFAALTEKNRNCFMVGDVKQSIYQFRLADPAIFIKKYNSFKYAESAELGEDRKIVLSSNFRSCRSVIDAVNDVFSLCMSDEVGGLHYGKDEMLYEGIQHTDPHELETELYCLDVREDTYAEEATFVAKRINELLDGTHFVRNGDAFRPITADDIVILLRSPGSVGHEYQMALEQYGISCVAGSGGDLLQTEEIQTLIALLQIINNPLQDIPLVTVLTSRVFCFTADMLVHIRAGHKTGSVYSALCRSTDQLVQDFLATLEDLREYALTNSLSALLMYIFNLTRIDSVFAALPDGVQRTENLQSFCRIVNAFESNSMTGLSKFLEHIVIAEQQGVPIQTAAKSDGAVTIMSIHKSKGLEFPVVFLCGLSRQFNYESLRAPVLCDNELGLGLSCVDGHKRIQYPSIAKNAIVAKQKAAGISEELRVLYVAMTRAKDRLIMVYSAHNVRQEVENVEKRNAVSEPLLLTSTVDCPGGWILLTAVNNPNWKITYVTDTEVTSGEAIERKVSKEIANESVVKIIDSLKFSYPYSNATITPSKQTATQLKGRDKDSEAAENTIENVKFRHWRKPGFTDRSLTAADRGNILHLIMQYICFDKCDTESNVKREIARLVEECYITQEEADCVQAEKITAFFTSDMGLRLRSAAQVLREFKFSILIENEDEPSDDPDNKILLQGVVDCAIIDEKIHIIDFKTDSVTKDTIASVVENYRKQLMVYAKALSEIYQKDVESAQLYFFHTNTFVRVL